MLSTHIRKVTCLRLSTSYIFRPNIFHTAIYTSSLLHISLDSLPELTLVLQHSTHRLHLRPLCPEQQPAPATPRVPRRRPSSLMHIRIQAPHKAQPVVLHQRHDSSIVRLEARLEGISGDLRGPKDGVDLKDVGHAEALVRLGLVEDVEAVGPEFGGGDCGGGGEGVEDVDVGADECCFAVGLGCCGEPGVVLRDGGELWVAVEDVGSVGGAQFWVVGNDEITKLGLTVGIAGKV